MKKYIIHRFQNLVQSSDIYRLNQQGSYLHITNGEIKKFNYFLNGRYIVTELDFSIVDLFNNIKDQNIDKVGFEQWLLKNSPYISKNKNYFKFTIGQYNNDQRIINYTYQEQTDNNNWEFKIHITTHWATLSFESWIVTKYNEFKMTKTKTDSTVKRESKSTASTATKESKRNKFFVDLEKRIIDSYPRLIRFDKLNKTGRKDKTVEEFLVRFFKEFNDEKLTIYVDDKSTQTDVERRRSIGDIFMITRYYYPDVTLEEVYDFLMISGKKHFDNGFRSSFCSQILKYVFYYNGNATHNVANVDKRAEWNYTYNEIKSELKKNG